MGEVDSETLEMEGGGGADRDGASEPYNYNSQEVLVVVCSSKD